MELSVLRRLTVSLAEILQDSIIMLTVNGPPGPGLKLVCFALGCADLVKSGSRGSSMTIKADNAGLNWDSPVETRCVCSEYCT